jgi:hypothetical protein
MPQLLTATGHCIELEPSRCYVLGRAPDCDVVVSNIASSRRHARLTVGAMPGALSIEDLRSRNGTFVNEERVAGRTCLLDGFRIRIGATVFLVRLHAPDPDSVPDAPDTHTLALGHLSHGRDVNLKVVRALQDSDHSGSSFAGQLGAFGLLEILQLLNQTACSGTLHLALEAGRARVEVRDGEVRCASFGELVGFDALVQLAHEETGLFWLIGSTDACPQDVFKPSSRLLIELCWALDDADNAEDPSGG